jgi:hypothetical protein
MSEILKAIIFDASTGKITEREFTAEEIAEREALQLEMESRQLEQESKATARASALAKLAELGLTEEEVAAL